MTIDLKELLFQDMQMDAHAMTDRVIVVTGAGQGIGLQTARAFAFLGAKVILAELSEQGKTAEELIQAEGGTARFIKTDVSDTDSVANLHREVHQSFGSADILINNAIFIKEGRVLEMTPETWDRTIAVNLRGTFLTCRAFLAEMLEMDRGLIINMVSSSF